MARINLDNLDTKILQMLVDNGRKPFLEIARECGVSGAAIHQRIAKLQATNILEGSRALIKPTTLGYDTCAFVGVFLKEPSKFNDFVEKLKNVPEVVECHFTTGQYDMLIKMYAHDNEHLLHLIHEKLQPLGLLRTETFVSFREVFSRALPVGNDYSFGRRTATPSILKNTSDIQKGDAPGFSPEASPFILSLRLRRLTRARSAGSGRRYRHGD